MISSNLGCKPWFLAFKLALLDVIIKRGTMQSLITDYAAIHLNIFTSSVAATLQLMYVPQWNRCGHCDVSVIDSVCFYCVSCS